MIGKVPAQVGFVSYGLILDMYSEKEGFEYVAGVEVSDFSHVPDDLRQVEIPARECVVFPHNEHLSELPSAMQTILEQWLPISGRRLFHVPGAPDFYERYDEDFGMDTVAGGIEVWIPIGPAKS